MQRSVITLFLTFVALACARGQWQIVIEDRPPSYATSIRSDANGTAWVVVNEMINDGEPDRSAIWEILPQGILVDSIALSGPSYRVVTEHLYRREAFDDLLATGMVFDTLPDLSITLRNFIAKVTDGSVHMVRFGNSIHEGRHGLGFVDLDGSLKFGHYDYDHNTWAYHLVLLCMIPVMKHVTPYQHLTR